MPTVRFEPSLNEYYFHPGKISLKKAYFDYIQSHDKDNTELVIVFDYYEAITRFEKENDTNYSPPYFELYDRAYSIITNNFFRYENNFFFRKVFEFFEKTINNKTNNNYELEREIAKTTKEFFDKDIWNTGYEIHCMGYYPAIIIRNNQIYLDIINNTLEPFNPEEPDYSRVFIRFSELEDTFFRDLSKERKERMEEG